MPTEPALALLAKHAPLVEVGAGSGLWAGLLRRRGVDVVAYDTAAFERRWNAEPGNIEEGATLYEPAGAQESFGGGVRAGGPGAAAEHADRALVLMWPDYGGKGTYALDALRAYRGDTLVLVGEWAGRTFGSYSAALPETGQSFSSDAQAYVEEHFAEVEVMRLPSFPMSLDCVAVYARRAAGRSSLALAADVDVDELD